jgi:molecular chaperone DnaK (HSP70)
VSHYLVGIDLGTTHTVVAYANARSTARNPKIQLFEIEQLVAAGEVSARSLLPSLSYHPAPGELAASDIQLLWPQSQSGGDFPSAIVGEYARELGAKVPGRLVASAKSWLSHPSVDRTAPILPWGATEDVAKISPLHASASYLAYVRATWNHRFPNDPLETQDVVLTLPASFDEAARALTVQAAKLAGLPQVRLVEEPQAACYDWLKRHAEKLESALEDVHLLLVCDVGGGTTDLTLIKVEHKEDGPHLERVGVGDHLMLGGDNMDLTLAHVVERRLLASGAQLDAASLSQLMQQCRTAKERLLALDAPITTKVTLFGRGAQLVGGARSTELSRDEVQGMVLDGFFPKIGAHERPQKRRSAVVEFGLPYVADPAVTRHVAAFLALHAQIAREALGDEAPTKGALPTPDAVLLNGGVFRSERLANRLLETLGTWRGVPLHILHNSHPELAVARGAVAYGMALQGKGVRIRGGSPRSYFLQVEDKPTQKRGVCLLSRGTEENHEIRLQDRTFSLRLGQPVRFYLASTTADTVYKQGEVLDIDSDNFRALPPIAAVLEDKTGRSDKPAIPVQLATMLTEVGTLAVNCVSIDNPRQRWKLEFQLRGREAGQVISAEGKVHPRFNDAVAYINRIFGSRSRDVDRTEVKKLRNVLEKFLGKRDNWDTSLLRELFASLWEGVRRRRRSVDHERVWFNLIGFCLRPGFGYPLDDWRAQQLWMIYDQGIQYVREAQVWAEWWILWRRVAGGLNEEAQQRILDDIAIDLQPPAARRKKPKGATKKQGYDDMVRLAASLERLPVYRKVEVGGWLLDRLQKKTESHQTWWAVGRLGARIPFYGSVHNTVPREFAAKWLEQALALDWRSVTSAPFAATMLSRMSGDRERDLDQEIRTRVLQRLRTAKASPSWIRMVKDVTELDEADEKQVFGESLPPGLRLIH